MSGTARACLDLVNSVEQDGFSIVAGVYSAQTCENLAAELLKILSDCTDEATALKRHNGVIYGARNLLNVFPPARDIWRQPPILELLTTVLGSEFGLVRGLFFDKPPESNWSLPWHQDLTIAVRDHSLPSQKFRNRTVKARVPHVEAPDEVLAQMLTLRIHLDPATDNNGPLQVLPGTHIGRHATPPFRPPVTILASAGDVLAMRPLLSHASGPSKSAGLHRRIIHLEFAAHFLLPDGYHWHEFISVKAL